MINISSLYYFTLLSRLSPKYKLGLSAVVNNVKQYLDEESLDFSMQKKEVWEYQLIAFDIISVWKIHLFHKDTRQKKFFYFPTFFCDIYVEKKYLQDTESTKNIIFFLSNIFECFDEFEEKNLLIEFHKGIEKTLNHNKKYFLRHDFMNINSLWRIYEKRSLTKNIQKFIEKNPGWKGLSYIKNSSPETYRTLLFLMYNIFALQKSYISTNKELSGIQKFEQENWENAHVNLSEQRLNYNKKSIETTLRIYKEIFENFLQIMTNK